MERFYPGRFFVGFSKTGVGAAAFPAATPVAGGRDGGTRLPNATQFLRSFDDADKGDGSTGGRVGCGTPFAVPVVEGAIGGGGGILWVRGCPFKVTHSRGPVAAGPTEEEPLDKEDIACCRSGDRWGTPSKGQTGLIFMPS